jgi:hypothetical protein
MNSRLGGFAAALATASYPLCVMNMISTVGNSSELGVIYERGLIGSYQDWLVSRPLVPPTDCQADCATPCSMAPQANVLRHAEWRRTS